MKKMIMVLMVLIVSMTTTLFAGTYVAFTSKEEFEEYCNSNHSEWDAQPKAFFEESDIPAKNKKKTTLIIVYDSGYDEAIKNLILVYAYDSKSFGVIIFDDHGDRIVDTGIFTYNKEYDPVMIGLSCLKERVTHILDLDKMEVIFCESKYVRNPDQK